MAGAGEYFALLLSSVAGMVVLASAENLVTLFVGLELLSIPLYALCATELRRGTSLEAGLKYLIVGSLGSATLLYGLAMIYGATGATDFGAIATAIGEHGRARRPAAPDRDRASPPPGWRSRRRSRRSTSGRPTSTRARPRRSRRSWRPPRRSPRSRSSCGCSTTRWPIEQLNWGPALAALAAVTIIVGQRRRAVPALAQAPARVVGRRAGRVPARRRRRRHAARDEGDVVLPDGLPAHERRRVRGGDRARAGVRDGRRPEVVRGTRPGEPAARVADDDRDARARRVPGHGRLHRKVLFDRCRRGGRLRVARRADRGRLDDLPGLLPARGRGDVDGRRGDRAPERQEGEAGRRLVARGRRPRPARGRGGRRRVRGRDDLLRARPVAACSTWRATSRPRSHISSSGYVPSHESDRLRPRRALGVAARRDRALPLRSPRHARDREDGHVHARRRRRAPGQGHALRRRRPARARCADSDRAARVGPGRRAREAPCRRSRGARGRRCRLHRARRASDSA